MTVSRLYYEAHVTVDAGEDFAHFQRVARQHGWRSSRFDEDEVDSYHGKWFASARNVQLEEIKSRIHGFVEALETSHYSVVRWKVEDTLLDSKYGDRL